MTSVNLADLFSQHEREDVITFLEPGTYELEVIRCSSKTSQNGNEGITPFFRVLNGPHAGDTASLGTMTLTENSRSIFFRNLKGFGLDKEFFDRNPTMKNVADAIVGRQIKAQVQADKWQGEDRNKLAIGGVTLIAAQKDPFAGGGISASPASTITAHETVPPAPPVPGSSPAPF